MVASMENAIHYKILEEYGYPSLSEYLKLHNLYKILTKELKPKGILERALLLLSSNAIEKKCASDIFLSTLRALKARSYPFQNEYEGFTKLMSIYQADHHLYPLFSDVLYMDYVGKVIGSDDWQGAMSLVSDVSQESVWVERQNVLLPTPHNSSEAGIRFYFGNYVQDNIRAVIALFGQTPFLVELGSSAILLRAGNSEKYAALQGALPFPLGNEPYGYSGEEYDKLFASDMKEPFRVLLACPTTLPSNESLYNLFERNNIRTLRISPSRWVNEFNLAASHIEGEREDVVQVIDKFDVLYEPAWFPCAKGTGEPDTFMVWYDSEEYFASAERRVISMLARRKGLNVQEFDLQSLSTCVKLPSGDHVKYFALCAYGMDGEPSVQDVVKNVMTWVRGQGLSYDRPRIEVKVKDSTIYVTASEISKLIFRNVEVAFTNICYGSKAQHMTIFNDESMAHGFLAAGCRSVVTTGAFVDKKMALRFGVEFWNRVFAEEEKSVIEIYRQLSFETRSGKLQSPLALVRDVSPALYKNLLSEGVADDYEDVGFWRNYQVWMRPK